MRTLLRWLPHTLSWLPENNLTLDVDPVQCHRSSLPRDVILGVAECTSQHESLPKVFTRGCPGCKCPTDAFVVLPPPSMGATLGRGHSARPPAPRSPPAAPPSLLLSYTPVTRLSAPLIPPPQCWCAKNPDLGANGGRVPQSQCDYTCAKSDDGEKCGGWNRMSVYCLPPYGDGPKTPAPAPVPAPPTPRPRPSGSPYSREGCFRDSKSGRIMRSRTVSDPMSAEVRVQGVSGRGGLQPCLPPLLPRGITPSAVRSAGCNTLVPLVVCSWCCVRASAAGQEEGFVVVRRAGCPERWVGESMARAAMAIGPHPSRRCFALWQLHTKRCRRSGGPRPVIFRLGCSVPAPGGLAPVIPGQRWATYLVP